MPKTELEAVEEHYEAKLAEANQRIAELEATVADMRQVLHDEYQVHKVRFGHIVAPPPDTETCPVCRKYAHALSSSAGQGWLSPEKAGELRALLARLRNILRPGDYIESQWRKEIDKVLEQ